MATKSTAYNISTNFSFVESVYWVLLTIFLFFIFNLVDGFLLRKCSKTLATHPNFWRFKNTTISWTHSLVITTLITLNYVLTPEIFIDTVNVSTKLSYVTICVSIGYFLYDAMDILYSNHKKLTSQNYEVLLHHFVIIGIFWIVLMCNLYVGNTLIALSMEFNTTFLHLRFMFVFNNVDKCSFKFRIVSFFNLVTFIVFRLLTLCWCSKWLIYNGHTLHFSLLSVAVIGLLTMIIMNLYLLKRLVQSDYMNSKINNYALNNNYNNHYKTNNHNNNNANKSQNGHSHSN